MVFRAAAVVAALLPGPIAGVTLDPPPSVSVPGIVVAGIAASTELPGSEGTARDGITVDSARAEFRAGRTWHAARLLEPLYRAGELEPADVFLLARARAGYRDWPGVTEVLESIADLGDFDDGAGWFLLGRAHEALGQTADAMDAYERALDQLSPLTGVTRASIEGRLSRVAWAEGEYGTAVAALDRIRDQPAVRSWSAAWMIEAAIEDEAVEWVDTLRARVERPVVLERLWDVPARAHLAMGDTAAAAALYRAALDRPDLESAQRARALRFVADAARRTGRDAEAASGYAEAVDLAAVGDRDGAWAARQLLDGSAEPSVATMLRMARHLDRDGDGVRALRAYDRYVAEVEAAGGDVSAMARVDRARLLTTVPARLEEGVREWRALATHPDPEVGARTLTQWSALRRRQGRIDDYRTLRRWLVERYPGTQEAAGVVFFRADAAHDQQRWDAAVAAYHQVAEMAPEVDYAGLSRMRAAQIHLHRGDRDAALGEFERYLGDFPTGRRWEEAAYWAARTHLEGGDSVAGLALLERLREEEPFSYYTVLTADLLGEPYRIELPEAAVGTAPEWIRTGFEHLDALEEAGLDEAAQVEADHLAGRARQEGADALMWTAEGLNLRDRTLTGINLGWAARRLGEPWTDRLVRIVYPFPYQELVLRAAREVGVDPLLLAGLIRQESAFVPDIVSSAGAIGLMQVMPSTGRELARRLGVANFTRETLESPEINIHLGARFLIDQLDRYDAELPLVLSAYNAGPARANRWRGFPEAVDQLRLTERIPFSETRGYVKNVTRNQRLYEALYGSELAALGR